MKINLRTHVKPNTCNVKLVSNSKVVTRAKLHHHYKDLMQGCRPDFSTVFPLILIKIYHGNVTENMSCIYTVYFGKY